MLGEELGRNMPKPWENLSYSFMFPSVVSFDPFVE